MSDNPALRETTHEFTPHNHAMCCSCGAKCYVFNAHHLFSCCQKWHEQHVAALRETRPAPQLGICPRVDEKPHALNEDACVGWVPLPETSPKHGLTKCGEPAEGFIPRWGWSFACVLPKGHEGEHKRGGTCFKHGDYVGVQCPQSDCTPRMSEVVYAGNWSQVFGKPEKPTEPQTRPEAQPPSQLDAFLEELSKIDALWFANKYGSLRCRFALTRGSDMREKNFNVITAVAFNKLGLSFRQKSTRIAAKKLGLDEKVQNDIYQAGEGREERYAELRSQLQQRMRFTGPEAAAQREASVAPPHQMSDHQTMKERLDCFEGRCNLTAHEVKHGLMMPWAAGGVLMCTCGEEFSMGHLQAHAAPQQEAARLLCVLVSAICDRCGETEDDGSLQNAIDEARKFLAKGE